MSYQTQVIALGNQHTIREQKQQPLTLERLRQDLCSHNLHGKKVEVPLSWINPLENHRSKIGDLTALKLQIQEVGLVQPIGIQLLDDKITVVFGHRRFSAFKELCKLDPIRFSRISCVLQVYHQAEQDRIIAQAVENLGRNDLKPLDESKVINELKRTLKSKDGRPYTNTQLGEFLGGVHRKTVELSLIIANWPEHIHQSIQENESHFSISVLRSIAKKGLKGADLDFAIKQALHEGTSKIRRVQRKRPSLSAAESKKYKSYLDQVELNYSQEEREFLYSQRKWLGSAHYRAAMQQVLSEFFSVSSVKTEDNQTCHGIPDF